MDYNKFDKSRLEKLAKKIKNKNEVAFDELFHSTRDYLFYFVFGILRNEEASDDILQETYLTVFEKITSYEGNNFLAWIMTIARNKAFNYYKKENRMTYLESSAQEFLLREDSNESELLLLSDMSKILKPDEMQIVMMHILGNYTHKQISNGLDIPLGTSTWKYNEAMKKLKSKLEG